MVGVADRADEEADQQLRMPVAAHAPNTPGVPQRAQILAEARDRLVRGQCPIGKPLRYPGLLDQRINEPGRIRRLRKDNTRRHDRHDAGADRRGNDDGFGCEPQQPDADEFVSSRIRVGGGKDQVGEGD